MVPRVSQRLNHNLLNLRKKLLGSESESVLWSVWVSVEEHICTRTWSHLHDSLEHWDEDKLDEPDLSGGFGDFISVHEGSHREALRLLPVTLLGTQVEI